MYNKAKLIIVKSSSVKSLDNDKLEAKVKNWNLGKHFKLVYGNDHQLSCRIVQRLPSNASKYTGNCDKCSPNFINFCLILVCVFLC